MYVCMCACVCDYLYDGHMYKRYRIGSRFEHQVYSCSATTTNGRKHFKRSLRFTQLGPSSLFYGREVLLRILVRWYPRGEHVSAMADHAFVAAILVLPFAVCYGGVRASVTYTSVRRRSLSSHVRSLSYRVHCRRWTRQRIALRWVRMYHLLLLLLLLLRRLLLLLMMLLRLLRYLLHLLLRYLRKRTYSLLFNLPRSNILVLAAAWRCCSQLAASRYEISLLFSLRLSRLFTR